MVGLRLRMMMMRRMRTRQDYGGEKRLKEGLLRQKDTREERKGGNYAGAEEKHKSIKRGVPGVLTVQGKGKNPRRKTGKNKRGRCSNFRQDTLCRGVKSQGKERRKKSKQNKKKNHTTHGTRQVCACACSTGSLRFSYFWFTQKYVYEHGMSCRGTATDRP